MTGSVDLKSKFFNVKPEVYLWFVKDLLSDIGDELSFTVTNLNDLDIVDEVVATLELDGFSSRLSDDLTSAYWVSKQPFTQNSCYHKLKLVICHGHPDWIGSRNESKSIAFNANDRTVFLYWNTPDISVINSIKLNLRCHKRLSLYIVLNEEDVFFKEDNVQSVKLPKLRSFSLTFE